MSDETDTGNSLSVEIGKPKMTTLGGIGRPDMVQPGIGKPQMQKQAALGGVGKPTMEQEDNGPALVAQPPAWFSDPQQQTIFHNFQKLGFDGHILHAMNMHAQSPDGPNAHVAGYLKDVFGSLPSLEMTDWIDKQQTIREEAGRKVVALQAADKAPVPAPNPGQAQAKQFAQGQADQLRKIATQSPQQTAQIDRYKQLMGQKGTPQAVQDPIQKMMLSILQQTNTRDEKGLVVASGQSNFDGDQPFISGSDLPKEFHAMASKFGRRIDGVFLNNLSQQQQDFLYTIIASHKKQMEQANSADPKYRAAVAQEEK